MSALSLLFPVGEHTSSLFLHAHHITVILYLLAVKSLFY
jgi:hypothetical protein